MRRLYAVVIRVYFCLLQWRYGKPVVAFFRNGGIGDIICTFPAAEKLKERHPGGLYIYCCNSAFKCLPEMSGLFDRVVSIRCSDFVAAYLKKYFFTYLFIYADEREDACSTEHLVDEFCKNFDVVPHSRQPMLHVSPSLVALTRSRLERLGLVTSPRVAIHSGPSWKVREWPASNWQRLVSGLCEEGVGPVLHLGAGRHVTLRNVQITKIPGTIDALDVLDLRETIAAISLSEMFIGIDSGLLHIAGAVGTRSIGLFGPTNPDLRLPTETPSAAPPVNVECKSCHHRAPRVHWQSGCPHDVACMRSIDPSMVLKLVRSMLEVDFAAKSEASSIPENEMH